MSAPENSALSDTQIAKGDAGCCTARTTAAVVAVEEERPQPLQEPSLEDLLPIAIVIAAGCETCAEKAVTRALEHGSPRAHIQRALQVVAKFQKLDCFAKAVGPEIVSRMERPLAAGNRTLREAANRS